MKYRPLKDYVAKHGGLRLAMQPRLRGQLVDRAVEEYPFDAPDDAVVDVLTARLTILARRQYGQVMSFVLVAASAALVAKLVHRWHGKRHAHRVLLIGWQDAARRGD